MTKAAITDKKMTTGKASTEVLVFTGSIVKPGFFVVKGIKKTNRYAHHLNLIKRRVIKAQEIERRITRYHGIKIHNNPNPICNKIIPYHFGDLRLKIFTILSLRLINKDAPDHLHVALLRCGVYFFPVF